MSSKDPYVSRLVFRILTNEKYAWIITAFKALRQGLVYGVRIRAPHALVMTFLFGRGTLLQKLHFIYEATKTHATNLGKFVFSYKLLTGSLQQLQGEKWQWHSMLVAAFVGYFVFGKNNSVNMQINLYLLSRVLTGLARSEVEKGYIKELPFDTFPLFAAVVWGLVLWQFEYHKHTLQPSLQSSMTYLYKDCDHWTGTLSDFLLTSHASP